MQEFIILLKQLGFREEEVAVYLALLEFGPQTVMMLSRKTRLYRPQIYAAIEILRERGLVTLFPRGKQRFYVAESPKKVRLLLNDMQSTLDRNLEVLEESYRHKEGKPTLHFLEGKKGVTSVFADLVDTLSKGETFYRYSSEKDLARTNSYLPRDYREARDKKSLERFVITSPSIGKQKKNRMERAMKYVPKEYDLFDQDVIELIYAHKVAFIDLNSESAVIVENAPLAEFQKKIFRLLYQKL